MIVPPRIEPPLILEFEVDKTYIKYTASVNPAGTVSDYYRFITTPSPERERFILSLSRTLLKADSHSIIELLS
jgi:hypothetical protein